MTRPSSIAGNKCVRPSVATAPNYDSIFLFRFASSVRMNHIIIEFNIQRTKRTQSTALIAMMKNRMDCHNLNCFWKIIDAFAAIVSTYINFYSLFLTLIHFHVRVASLPTYMISEKVLRFSNSMRIDGVLETPSCPPPEMDFQHKCDLIWFVLIYFFFSWH